MPLFLAIFGMLGALFAVGQSNSDTPATAETPPMSGDEAMPVEGAPMQPEDMTPEEEDDMGGGDGDMGDMGDGDGDMGGDHGDMGGDHTNHPMPDPNATYTDITAFGAHHGTSSHTTGHSLEGGRTAITTEAMLSYNALRDFLGLEPTDIEAIGTWAFANDMTNNDMAYGDDVQGVGLYYGMQGAKVGWIRDDAFDPQLLADIQRTARLGEPEEVMQMVETHGHDGFAAHLETNGLVDTFINTMKMEPHYGGWMHGRTHGDLGFEGEGGGQVATAHDLNHLTVLSHDQSQPFMNDTFDYPQWPALEAPEADVINYFQSMVTLTDPLGEGISSGDIAAASMSAGEALMATLAMESVNDADLPVEPEDAAPELVDLF